MMTGINLDAITHITVTRRNVKGGSETGWVDIEIKDAKGAIATIYCAAHYTGSSFKLITVDLVDARAPTDEEHAGWEEAPHEGLA